MYDLNTPHSQAMYTLATLNFQTVVWKNNQIDGIPRQGYFWVVYRNFVPKQHFDYAESQI